MRVGEGQFQSTPLDQGTVGDPGPVDPDVMEIPEHDDENLPGDTPDPKTDDATPSDPEDPMPTPGG